ncbi:MAG TPA: KamA family radical SAM protein [Desulfobacterales bacterium]|nr:KamA family radical SAM protein [Desulfobacterales bacterium]
MHLKRAYVLRRNDALKKTSKPPSFAAALKPGDRESEQSNADEPPSLALAVNAASYAPSPSQFGFESPPITKRPRPRIVRKQVPLFAKTAEWNDWKWQLQHRICDIDALSRFITLSRDEREALESHAGMLPLAITPYYAGLLDKTDPLHPLRRAVVPVKAELAKSAGETEDPLGEEADSPVPGLVHRYPDRVLFLVTDFCSTYCRYCTRSRMVGRCENHHATHSRWEKSLAYIQENSAIRDVLISGGDPLTLPDEPLEWLLLRLRKIPHVEIVRIGTKVPVVLPQRITPRLVKMLRHYHPLWINIHFMHPAELTPETSRACNRLADSGIPLGSQTVLLKGINDDVETMKKLMLGLLKVRVRPYYIYQCDPIPGSAHFRTSVEKGLEIIQGLRGHTTGLAVPNYVIDAPGGGGKIPMLPAYTLGRDGDDILLRNYEGLTYRYPDTCGKAEACVEGTR